MNWRSSVLWGFVGTILLTGIMSGSQALGQTRMSLPFMLGTMFTPDRDRAKLVGTGVHFVNGWLLAFDLCRGVSELASYELVAGVCHGWCTACSCSWS